MAPDGSSFTALNVPRHLILPQDMSSFSLHALPNTDLWRKPPRGETSTAPMVYTALRQRFVSAEVTVSAEWELEWDQGGLVIFAGAPPGHVAARPASTPAVTPGPDTLPPYATAAWPASRWVKAGLEYSQGTPHLSSTCATSHGCDCALTPLSSLTSCGSPQRQQASHARIKLERVGFALCIYVWKEEGSRVGAADDAAANWAKLRELTSFFWDVEDKAVRVGVYASRPADLRGPAGVHPPDGDLAWVDGGPGDFATTRRALLVEFDGLEIT